MNKRPITTARYAGKPPLLDEADLQLPLADRGEGCIIWDADGKDYIDACSGAITTSLGHNHRKIKAAIADQLDRIAFTYRTQFNTQVKVDLSSQLAQLSGGVLTRSYFVGSGSEAVESCIKMALQYFQSIGQPQRTVFASLRPSYHGSTLGALGLTGYTPLEQPFKPAIIQSLKLPSPNYYRREEPSDSLHDISMISAARQAIEASSSAQKLAAIVVEPVGGASTGARVLSQAYMTGLRQLCDETGALLIADEVLTGIGRVGQWFAWQNTGVAPDIMALAKGLGSGYYPIGAMLCNEEVAAPVIASGGFMHGHTYAGSPLGCAVGMAVLKTIEEDKLLENARRQGRLLKKELEKFKALFAFVGDVRGDGLLMAMEFVQNQQSKEPFPPELNFNSIVTQASREAGLLVYPRRCLDGVRGDHILITPPLIIGEDTILEISNRLSIALEATAAQARL